MEVRRFALLFRKVHFFKLYISLPDFEHLYQHQVQHFIFVPLVRSFIPQGGYCGGHG